MLYHVLSSQVIRQGIFFHGFMKSCIEVLKAGGWSQEARQSVLFPWPEIESVPGIKGLPDAIKCLSS